MINQYDIIFVLAREFN